MSRAPVTPVPALSWSLESTVNGGQVVAQAPLPLHAATIRISGSALTAMNRCRPMVWGFLSGWALGIFRSHVPYAAEVPAGFRLLARDGFDRPTQPARPGGERDEQVADVGPCGRIEQVAVRGEPRA